MLTLELRPEQAEMLANLQLRQALHVAFGCEWKVQRVTRLADVADTRLLLTCVDTGRWVEVVIPMMDGSSREIAERIFAAAERIAHWFWSPASDLPMEVDGWWTTMGPRLFFSLLGPAC